MEKRKWRKENVTFDKISGDIFVALRFFFTLFACGKKYEVVCLSVGPMIGCKWLT